MVNVAPWLLELGVVFDAIAFIITLLVASMGFRLYKTFRKPSHLQFSVGLLFMSASYLFYALINFLAFAEETRLPVLLTGEQLHEYLLLFTQIRFVMMMIGLLILIYLYYDIQEWSLRTLLGLLMLLALFLGYANDFTFFMLSALFLFFIALKLYQHYRLHPETTAFFVLLGFTSLFVAKLLSGVLLLSGGVFLVAYLFKLAGVLMILLSLWVISR
jgi:hypothetical protein